MKNTALKSRTTLVATCVVAPLWAASAAFAQDAAQSDSTALPTVVVTSLKTPRAELDTPASVSVVSASDLQSANISSARQLSGIVPGYFSMEGTSGDNTTFRGLGSNASDPTIESSVGMFVDGIYLGHTRDYTMPLFDVSQVEFIAGSESTILGKNTSLGAVSVTNRTPQHKLGYDVSYTHTSAIDGDRLVAAVDLPISSDFALRIVGFSDDNEGVVRNDTLSQREPDTKEQAARFVLQGDLGESTSLLVSYQHDRRRVTGEPFVLLTDPNHSLAGIAASLGQANLDVGFNDTTTRGSTRLDPSLPAVALPYENEDGDRATAILNSDLPAGYTLTAQTSFVHWNSPRVTDLDLTNFLLFDLLDHDDNRMYSQEIRITSPANGKLQYIAGVFLYKDDYSLIRDVQSDLPITAQTYTRINDLSQSVFASGSYNLTKQWDVRAGVRQTWEGKTPTYSVAGSPNVVVTQIPLTTLPTANESLTDGNAGIDFRPSKDTLIYANWSRGSKGGGFQSVPDSLAVAHYGAEVALTSELGAKLNFRRNGYLQLAVYDTTVHGFQTGRTVIVPPASIPQTMISNANVRSTGLELSGAWSATKELALNGSLSDSRARFTQDLLNEDSSGASTVEIYKGMPLPRAPRFMGLFGANYRANLGGNLELTTQGTIRRVSEADLQFRSEHPTSPTSEAYTDVDLQLKLGKKGTGWSVSLIGNNLTNERHTTFASESFLDGDAYYGSRNLPRTVALRLEIEQ